MNKYKLKYDIKIETCSEGYDKSDAGEYGLTDKLIVISIIELECGGYSQCLFTFNKDKEPLSQEEIFKTWLTLGLSLSNQNELKEWRKEMVDTHSKNISTIFDRLSSFTN